MAQTVLLEKTQVIVDSKEITYRIPLAVHEVCVFSDGNSFSVCPRCGLTLEREYMNFCDRCGQKLDWKEYEKAVVIRVK